MNHATFTPDWASAPGDTIADMLDEKQLSRHKFSELMSLTHELTEKLIEGNTDITAEIAEKLQSVLGVNSQFWINREAQYREDLVRQKQNEEKAWMKEIPFAEILKFKWLTSVTGVVTSNELLDYFGVPNVRAWRERYTSLLQAAVFRTSPSYESNLGSVATWLRRGELVSQSIVCENWDKEKFRTLLPRLKSLSLQKDPTQFLPELCKSCASCGVAVVVARAPRGCRASGATFFVEKNKAVLLLSFRYLLDDHFWFTFFHEAGHLILHSGALFLEGDDTTCSQEEQEANAFAEAILVPVDYRQRLLSLDLNVKAILRFSKELGIAPGIVVGQLEHHGRINRKIFFGLKRRFAWD